MIPCTALPQLSPSFYLRPHRYMARLVSYAVDSPAFLPIPCVAVSAPSLSLSRPRRPCMPLIPMFSALTVRCPERITSFVLFASLLSPVISCAASPSKRFRFVRYVQCKAPLQLRPSLSVPSRNSILDVVHGCTPTLSFVMFRPRRYMAHPVCIRPTRAFPRPCRGCPFPHPCLPSVAARVRTCPLFLRLPPLP